MSDEFQELALSDFLKTRIKDLIADHKDHLANGTIKDSRRIQKAVWNYRGFKPRRKRVG